MLWDTPAKYRTAYYYKSIHKCYLARGGSDQASHHIHMHANIYYVYHYVFGKYVSQSKMLAKSLMTSLLISFQSDETHEFNNLSLALRSALCIEDGPSGLDTVCAGLA